MAAKARRLPRKFNVNYAKWFASRTSGRFRTFFCVHKANQARFYARSRDGRDSTVTWEIVYNLEQRFLRETFIYRTKVSHQNFWSITLVSLALCIFQKIAHFLYSYPPLLSAIELSMFLLDWSLKFRQKNNTILYLNLL